jgi:OmcA/MtrC family decaheme c-type cytochrome
VVYFAQDVAGNSNRRGMLLETNRGRQGDLGQWSAHLRNSISVELRNMKTRLTVSKVARIASLITILPGAVLLTSASKFPFFTQNDKAFYASSDAVNFVRPGLIVKIQSAEIATDGTVKAKVKFTDPQGLPLDKDGVTTPGKISNGSPGMVVAVIPKGQTQFNSYTTRSQTSPTTKVTAIQAGADSGGAWEKTAEGEYTYTFKTKAPSGYDRSAVHAVLTYANRNLTEFEMGTQLDDDVYYFVPETGKATTNPREIIKTATCQKCHGPNMRFHGETGRTSMQACDICHQPQTTDPDTGNTVDMKVMVHKIHMGEHLPSVAAGKPYQIIGNGNSMHDFSTVAFPSPMMDCNVCHEQNKNAAQQNAHLLNPTRAACGSCHDNVNFDTGENHVNLPMFNDNQCKNCHIPQGEGDFDASISGAHVVPQQSSLLGGLQWGIVKVDDGVAGKKPTVTFTVKDGKGNPLALTDLARVALTMAGPTTDYTAFGKGYIQDDASKATGSNGTFMWTMSTAIPADAKGTFAIGIEGRRLEKVLAGTKQERSIQYGAKNALMYFSVDGSKVNARREAVDTAQCLQCHTRLALHGENRVDNVQYCVFCHNPAETDAARRPATAGAPQTIDMKFLAHRVHGGEVLHEEYGTDYTVYGFGGSKNSFAEVRYPGELNQCFMCHKSGSESPGPASTTYSAVKTPQYPLNPTGPVTTACYGCHDNNVTLSHALANTTQLGEACTACHSANYEFSPTKMHANEVKVDPAQASK